MVLFFVVVFSNIVSSQVEEFRGVWITNVDSKVLETDEKVAEGMDYLASIGINVIFPVVYNKGYTLYPSEVFESHFKVKTLQANGFMDRDFLERVIIEAHRNGIEVIPWFEFGFSTSYSENGGHIIKKYPDWALKDRSGNLVVKNGFDWMSAIHPEVQGYMTSLILEVIDKYDIDGIQGDDRLPAMPSIGGYEDYTVELYKSENGGLEPPSSYTNPSWKKWRADKLTQYLSDLRDSIKARDENIIISSSPTPYYWGYNEYLQDSKQWAKEKLVDNLIPQLYQYSMTDYNYALNTTVSQVRSEYPEVFFAGILSKSGSYVIDTDLLGNMIEANRNKNVMGECFFFYEGLRANNNRLGDYLKENFYSEKALIPYRKGNVRRPKAAIVNETDEAVTLIGNWAEYPMKGYEEKIYRTNDTSDYAAAEYNLTVSENAFYDVYIYAVPNTPWHDKARYTLYSDSTTFNGADSLVVLVDQSNTQLKGWQKIGTTYLKSGTKKVFKLDNSGLQTDKYIFTDAAMIMINRKIKPSVVSGVHENKKKELPQSFELSQNYPNPFNPETTIEYSIANRDHVKLSVVDILGQELNVLVDENKSAGNYKVKFDGKNLPSGIYFSKLNFGNKSKIRKMMLIK
ncbi:MAG: family 10 glycosylhydrolase [Melioribacteraceae bacterium]|nr:family 10 glycosylhydrolase [Melioribacteraceae bacterium]